MEPYPLEPDPLTGGQQESQQQPNSSELRPGACFGAHAWHFISLFWAHVVETPISQPTLATQVSCRIYTLAIQ